MLAYHLICVNLNTILKSYYYYYKNHELPKMRICLGAPKRKPKIMPPMQNKVRQPLQDGEEAMMGNLILNWFITTTPPVIYAILALFIPYELLRATKLIPVLQKTWKRVKPRLYW